MKLRERLLSCLLVATILLTSVSGVIPVLASDSGVTAYLGNVLKITDTFEYDGLTVEDIWEPSYYNGHDGSFNASSSDITENAKVVADPTNPSNNVLQIGKTSKFGAVSLVMKSDYIPKARKLLSFSFKLYTQPKTSSDFDGVMFYKGQGMDIASTDTIDEGVELCNSINLRSDNTGGTHNVLVGGNTSVYWEYAQPISSKTWTEVKLTYLYTGDRPTGIALKIGDNAEQMITFNRYYLRAMASDEFNYGFLFDSNSAALVDDVCFRYETTDNDSASLIGENFKETYKDTINIAVEDIAVSDMKMVEAGISEYNTLRADVKEYLSAEKAKLDALLNEIERQIADIFKTTHSGIINKDADSVTTADIPAINAAIVEYDGYSDNVKAHLKNEISHLQELKIIVFPKEFEEKYASLLDVSFITNDTDLELFLSAVEEYYVFSADIKLAISEEYNKKLDELKASYFGATGVTNIDFSNTTLVNNVLEILGKDPAIHTPNIDVTTASLTQAAKIETIGGKVAYLPEYRGITRQRSIAVLKPAFKNTDATLEEFTVDTYFDVNSTNFDANSCVYFFYKDINNWGRLQWAFNTNGKLVMRTQVNNGDGTTKTAINNWAIEGVSVGEWFTLKISYKYYSTSTDVTFKIMKGETVVDEKTATCSNINKAIGFYTGLGAGYATASQVANDTVNNRIYYSNINYKWSCKDDEVDTQEVNKFLNEYSNVLSFTPSANVTEENLALINKAINAFYSMRKIDREYLESKHSVITKLSDICCFIDERSIENFKYKNSQILSMQSAIKEDKDAIYNALREYNNLTTIEKMALYNEGQILEMLAKNIAEYEDVLDFTSFYDDFESDKNKWSVNYTNSENYIADIVAEPGNPSNKILKIQGEEIYITPDNTYWPEKGKIRNLRFRMKYDGYTAFNPPSFFYSYKDSNNYCGGSLSEFSDRQRFEEIQTVDGNVIFSLANNSNERLDSYNWIDVEINFDENGTVDIVFIDNQGNGFTVPNKQSIRSGKIAFGFNCYRVSSNPHLSKTMYVDDVYAQFYEDSVIMVDKTTDITDYLEYRRFDSGIRITKANKNLAGDIVVPATIDGCPIEIIDNNAFANCEDVTSVTLPDTITRIGDKAFQFCYALKSINFPEGITYIGHSAFKNCRSLENVTIKAENLRMGAEAFENCRSLTSLKISGSIGDSLKKLAFANCINLATIELPDNTLAVYGDTFNNTAYYNNPDNWEDNVLYIGKHLIRASSELSGDYAIKEGTQSIAAGAFQGCTQIKNITIPNGITAIWSLGCDILENIYISKTVSWIEPAAFEKCQNIIVDKNNIVYYSENGVLFRRNPGTTVYELIRYPAGRTETEYEIPSSVDIINVCAFRNASNLTNIIIPDGVSEIQGSAFENCDGLTSITIPSGTWSSSSLFNNCDNLKTIYYEGDMEKEEEISYWIEGLEGVELVPAALSYIIENEEVTITDCDEAYSGGMKIPSTVEGYPVTKIGDAAFDGCADITDFIIPSTVTSIGNNAFEGCVKPKILTLPESITTIGTDAFKNCSNLSYIYFTGSKLQWEQIDNKDESFETINLAFKKLESERENFVENNPELILENIESSNYGWKPTTQFVTEDNKYSITSNSYAAWFNEDSLSFAYKEYDYNSTDEDKFVFEATLDSATFDTSNSQHGIMIRSSLENDSSNVYLQVRENEVCVVYRGYDGSSSAVIRSTIENFDFPITLKVEVIEGVFYCYYKIGDGEYVRLASLKIKFNNKLYAGLTSCSTVEETSTSAVFKDLKVIIGQIYTARKEVNEETALKPVLENATDNSVTLEAIEGYEYSMDGVNWQDSNVFTNLEAANSYTFYQRIAENETHYASKTSESRTIKTANHTYDNACDKVCNSCGQVREVENHVYENACDKSCNICGALRGVEPHVFTNGCDTTCDICGMGREAEHVYDTTCDSICNECGKTRVVTSHSYDNACDKVCNECEAEREITHTFEWVIDKESDCINTGVKYEECTVCHATQNEDTIIDAIGEHTYDNENDADCNMCGEKRVLTTLTLESITAYTDSLFTVDLTIDKNFGFSALNLGFDYNVEQFELVSIENKIDSMNMMVEKSVVWDGTENHTQNGSIATLTFKVKEGLPVGEYDIGVKFFDASNSDFERVEMSTVSAKINVNQLIFGDVSGDGTVDTVDLAMIRKYLADRDPVTGECDVDIKPGADANSDGTIDTIDLAMIRKYLANKDIVTGESSVVLGPR